MGKMKTLAMIDRLGHRLSQTFAETFQGDVYFFNRSGLDGTSFPAISIWGGWEYPALTRILTSPELSRWATSGRVIWAIQFGLTIKAHLRPPKVGERGVG